MERRQTMNDRQRLLTNLAIVALLGGLGYFAYWYFSDNSSDELIISDTPIQIESIRTIAEISTVNYLDEVVMDSVERYTGKLSLYDPREWPIIYDRSMNRDIKRRLTIIVHGEVRYGIELTDGNYKIDQSSLDTILVSLPKAKIIDVILTPKKTEIFQEQGEWTDRERKILENQAKNRLMKNAKRLNLEAKAEKNALHLFKKMIKTDKKLIISFD
ncbi:MAG: hypothetical protein ACI837_000367 [Crocinitomicaceae bacterium]|jgi:hypothetical protein